MHLAVRVLQRLHPHGAVLGVEGGDLENRPRVRFGAIAAHGGCDADLHCIIAFR